jgi:hypothetical protein
MSAETDPLALMISAGTGAIVILLGIVQAARVAADRRTNERLKSLEESTYGDGKGSVGLWGQVQKILEWRLFTDKRLDAALTSDAFEREMKAIAQQNEGQSSALRQLDSKVEKIDRTVMLSVRSDSRTDTPTPKR